MGNMFCFQCEQTAGGKGCTGKAGVCGKQDTTANFQDELTGALIGLARAVEGNVATENTHRIMIEGLFSTITNVNFNNDTLKSKIAEIHKEKEKLIPNCSSCATKCVRNDDVDMREIWSANEDIRSLKSLILFGIRGMAAYAYHAYVLGYTDDDVNNFFYKALFYIGEESFGID